MSHTLLILISVAALWILPGFVKGGLEDHCLRNGFGKCSTAKLCEREKSGVKHHTLCPTEGVFPEQLVCCEKLKNNIGDCQRVGGLCMSWCADWIHYVDSRCPDQKADCLQPKGNCSYCCRLIM